MEIIVADISTFEMDASYDRIFSIEMFEVGLCASCHTDNLCMHVCTLLMNLTHAFLTQHMKNYKKLLKKIAGWLKEDGFLFIHYFCHKAFAYHFEVKFIKF